MDPRVAKMIEDAKAAVPQMPPMPQMPQAAPQDPVHAAMLPGVLQVEMFTGTRLETADLVARVNAFLIEMPERSAIVDRSFVVEGDSVTLLLVVKIPT